MKTRLILKLIAIANHQAILRQNWVWYRSC